MPRVTNEYCEVCARLVDLSREYGPKRKVYPAPTARDIYREHILSYDGVEPLASRPREPMKRLYVRDSGVNKAIGHICEWGHVNLEEGAFPEPDGGEAHVITRHWPPSVICRATGEVVPTRQ